MMPLNYWALFTQGRVDDNPTDMIVDGVVLDKMTCYNNHNPSESTRRQYEQTKIGLPEGNHKMNFDMMVPDDWVFRPDWVNVNDIHGRNAVGQSMNMYIINDTFHLTFPNPDGGPNLHEFTFPMERNRVYQFRNALNMTYNKTGNDRGFFKLIVDGEELTRFRGNLIWEGDEVGKGPYWKIAPYVGRDNWPDDVEQRTLYVRV